VRDDLRSYVLERLGTKAAILAIDETSFRKRGDKSAGVQVQYCGTTGQLENCQVAVFLSFITAGGHALIDRELYLPLSWTQDPQRRQEADIPETARFQTKCELAVQMLQRMRQAQIPVSWIVADSVYGGNLDLRAWCEQHQYPYVFAVACNEPVGVRAVDGQRYRVECRDVEALLQKPLDWQRLSMSEGTKGPRLFDWARVPLLHGWEEDGHHWLLLRRTIDAQPSTSYFLVFAPLGTNLPEMVKTCGARWHIEEDFEATKDMGLDHYEVRSFVGWYRHVTLVMLAYAFLVAMRASLLIGTSPAPADPSPKPLSTPEMRHLLGTLIWPAPSGVRFVLGWSWWRRSHQGRATYFHTKRRLEAG
jgi:SRSO17 transposase